MAQMNFNANQVNGDVKDFSLIPKGKYPAVIIATKMEPTNDKGTQQLHVTWEIVDGQHAKRQVSNWITVACPSSVEAQDIGMRQLKNICEAVGLAGFTDTDEMVGRQHIIDVGERKDNRDASKIFNEVKRCYPSGSAAATPAASQASPQTSAPVHTPAQQPAQQAQPAGGATPPPAAKRPPWMK